MGQIQIKRLTEQQENFLFDIVYGGYEPFDAYKRQYNCSSIPDARIRFEAKKLMSMEKIQLKYKYLLNERAKDSHVNEAYVIKELKDFIRNTKTGSAKVKAIELLGKTLGMFHDVVVNDDSEHTVISEQIRQNRERIEAGEAPIKLHIEDSSSDYEEEDYDERAVN